MKRQQQTDDHRIIIRSIHLRIIGIAGDVKPKPVIQNDLTTDRMIHSKINSNLLFYLHGKKIACELYTTIAAEAGLAWKITGGVSAELGEFPWMVSADFFVKLKIFEFCFIRIWEIIGCNKL